MSEDPDRDPVPNELKDGTIVIEAGAYEGKWAAKVCATRPHCTVYAFEPATRAHRVAAERLKGLPVVLHDFGIGARARQEQLYDNQRDGANIGFTSVEPHEAVRIVDVHEVMEPLGEVALMHLNAEGAEVEILERVIETGLIERVGMVLAQWHPHPQLRPRIQEIYRQLSKTHSYEARDLWHCWIRRPPIVVLLKTWEGPSREIAHGRLERMGETLSSLEQYVNCPFRWYVVDDGSGEWFVNAVKEKMGERHYILTTGNGAGGDIGVNLNDGLRSAFSMTDVVLNWSDDVVLQMPLDVKSYVSLLRADDRFGYIVLRPTHPTLCLSPLESDGHRLHAVGLDSPGKFLVGTSLNLMHRRAWDVYGPWPEGLRIDLAQEEMAWRIRRFADGPKIAIPDELVNEQGSVTYGTHSTWDWRLTDEKEKKAWYRYRNYAARLDHV